MTYGRAYPKIHSLFKRDPERRNVVIPGDWAAPEFAYLADLDWQWTEKVDGTNIRLYWNGSMVTLGGRTDNAQIPATLVKALAPLSGPDPWLSLFGDGPATVYGEGYGAGIQKGGLYRQDQALVVFDVQVGGWWLRRADVLDVAGKLSLDVVPVVGNFSLREAWERTGDPALSSAWPGARIEGMVGRPLVELSDRGGRRIIAKTKVKDFADLARSEAS